MKARVEIRFYPGPGDYHQRWLAEEYRIEGPFVIFKAIHPPDKDREIVLSGRLSITPWHEP
jgi:hypothetical protein